MTTVPPLWPSTLPQVALLDGYGETFPDTIYRSPMEFGPAKSRRRTSAGIRHISWPIILTSAELDILYDFYNDTLLGGNIPFEHYHPRNNEGLERNLLLHSEDFSGVGWVVNNTTLTAAATTAPDGLLTGTKMDETAVDAYHTISSYYEGFDDNETVTWSIHVKKGERDFGYHLIQDKEEVFVGLYFNANLGTITGYQGVTVSSGIVDTGAGWYRVWASADVKSGAYTPAVVSGVSFDADTRTYLGVAATGLYIWGAQLERGSLTDYKATVGAPTPGFYMRFVEPPTFTPRGLRYHGVMELEVLP